MRASLCTDDTNNVMVSTASEERPSKAAETSSTTRVVDFYVKQGNEMDIFSVLNLAARDCSLTLIPQFLRPAGRNSTYLLPTTTSSTGYAVAMVGLDVLTTLVVVTKALYDAAQEAKESHEECFAIHMTVMTLERTLREAASEAEYTSIAMHRRFEEIARIIEQITRTIKNLIDKPFLYKVIHRRRIQSKLKKARTTLYDATNVFQVGAQAETLLAVQQVKQKIQDIEDARKRDEAKAATEYENSSTASEEEIIQTLGVGDKQMPEAMLALSKHTKVLFDGPEKAWCERGLDAMRRRTGDLRIVVDRFAISSLEFSIHYEKKLGAGGFAKVYRGTYNDTAVAVKVLTEGTPWSVLESEINVWKDLSHPNILQFIGACPIAEPPFMISELKPNGDVLDYLRREPKASRHKILHEASLGLLYLHERSIVHGDLKATNILIAEDGSACLADFGLSRIKLQTTTIISPTDQPQKGTARWMAPEQLRGSLASRSSDIYSFAMTIYEIFTGRPPFPDTPDSMLYALVCERGIRPRLEDVRPEVVILGLNDAMWEVVENCWKQNPKDRWTAGRLRDGLHRLLESGPLAKSQQPAGKVAAPPLRQSLSAGASFMPSRPKEFLQSYTSRPAPPAPSSSAPSVVPYRLDDTAHEDESGEASLVSGTTTSAQPEPSHNPPFEFEVTTSDEVSPSLDTRTLTSDYLSSTCSTPDRNSMLLPLQPTMSMGLAKQQESSPHSSGLFVSHNRDLVVPSLGPHPSKSLPAAFSELAQAAHNEHSIFRPISPGALILFADEGPSPSLIDLIETDEPSPKSQSPPIPASDISSTSSKDVLSEPPSHAAADEAVASAVVAKRPDNATSRTPDPEPSQRLSGTLIDIPNQPKLKSLPLSEEDIVLPFPGREERLHPDLAPLTWDHPVSSFSSLALSHSPLPLSPYAPLEKQTSYFPEHGPQPTSETSATPEVAQEKYTSYLDSPPLETPSLADSTPRLWELSPVPSSSGMPSPDLDSPEELPELDNSLDIKRRTIRNHTHYSIS